MHWVRISVREYISQNIFNFNFSVRIACGHGSFLWWCCHALCTSGFVDVVIFSHKGPLVYC